MDLYKIEKWIRSKPENRLMTDAQIILKSREYIEFWNWAICYIYEDKLAKSKWYNSNPNPNENK